MLYGLNKLIILCNMHAPSLLWHVCVGIPQKISAKDLVNLKGIKILQNIFNEQNQFFKGYFLYKEISLCARNCWWKAYCSSRGRMTVTSHPTNNQIELNRSQQLLSYDRVKSTSHGRRIKTEEKANVVAYVWGEEVIQFLDALAILPRKILKNRVNSSFSFKSSMCNSSYV